MYLPVWRLSTLVTLLALATPCLAGELVTKTVNAKGRCYLGGNVMGNACDRAALNDARAKAVEQVAGLSLFSASAYKMGLQRADYLQVFSKGYVVAEGAKVWKDVELPVGANESAEYFRTVALDITVAVLPQAGENGFHMDATLSGVDGVERIRFISKEKVVINIQPLVDAWVYVFSVDANDQVTRLFPNPKQPDNRVPAKSTCVFPSFTCGMDLEVEVVEGMSRNDEAFLIVAFRDEQQFDERIPFATPLKLTEFYRRLMKFPLEDAALEMLPYVVVAAR